MSIQEGIGDRYTVLAAGRVTGATGAIASGVGFACVRTGTGVFAVTLDEAVDSTNVQIQISIRAPATGAVPTTYTIVEDPNDRLKTVTFFNIPGTGPLAPADPGAFDLLVSSVV